jgi:Glycosyl-4,4'-diaponeurosporenoate acyltransferase
MVGVNILWFTPIIVYFVHLCSDRPARGALLALVTAACGTVTGRLPLRWFMLTRWEVERTPYRRLGVRRFRALVHEGELMNRLARWGRTITIQENRRSLEVWRQRSLVNERIHWAWLLLSLPIATDAVAHGDLAFACYLVLANVPFNVYPVLLQRDTRARLTRMLEPKR